MSYIFVGGGEHSGAPLVTDLLRSDADANPPAGPAVLLRHMVEAYRDGKEGFGAGAKDYFADLDSYRRFHGAVVGRFLDSARNRFAPARHLVLEEAGLITLFPDLFELLPQARFIVVVRDPRDAIAAMMRSAARSAEPGHVPHGAGRDIGRYARRYRRSYRAALSFADPAYRKNLGIVKFEELFESPDPVLDRMRKFTGLRLPRSAADRVLDSHGPKRGSGIGGFASELSAAERDPIHRELGEFMTRFRYERRPRRGPAATRTAPASPPSRPRAGREAPGRAPVAGASAIEVIRAAKPSGRALVTLATGKYFGAWEKYCRANWVPYAERHGLDIVVCRDRISPPERRHGRTVHWDKCLILSQDFSKDYDAIAWLDTDIVINHHTAPCVFDGWDETKIRALSLVRGVPNLALKSARTAQLRKRWVTPRYGSSYIDVPAFYRAGGYKDFPDDYINGGVMLFAVARHRTFLESVFDKYENAAERGLSWMEQTAISYELFSGPRKLHQPLPYAFNTLWDLELAEKYPFLYVRRFREDTALALYIRQTAILNAHFLHFLGLQLEKALFARLLDPRAEKAFFDRLGGPPKVGPDGA